MDAVWQARTYGELDRLTADLPPPIERIQRQQAERHAAEEAERKRRDLAEYIGEWQHWLGGAAIMVGIWAVISVVRGELIHFWPAVPIGIWAIVLIVAGIFGSSSSDDEAEDEGDDEEDDDDYHYRW